MVPQVLTMYVKDEPLREMQETALVALKPFLLLVGYRFKFNCLLARLGTIGGMLSVGIFLRNPNPYSREFWRKPLKTRTP